MKIKFLVPGALLLVLAFSCNSQGKSISAPRKPFPQEMSFENCIKPELSQKKMNDDITEFYNVWRKQVIPYSFTNGAVDGSSSGYILKAGANGEVLGWDGYDGIASQSEAQGYTMIITALMAGYDESAKEIFDGLYKVYVNFPCVDNENLMSWVLPADGDLSRKRQPSATDGDMDTAYALLLAHNQWGGGPSHYSNITYLDAALKIIEGLKQNNIHQKESGYFPRIGIGDHLKEHNYDKYYATRACDFMLEHLYVFYDVTKDEIWKDTANVILNKIIPDIQADGNILPPDFMGNLPESPEGISTFTGISDEAEGERDNQYYYNSCRFPWRYAMGFAHYQLEEAKTALDKVNEWLITSKDHLSGGKFNPSKIKANYSRTGEVMWRDWGDGPDMWSDDSFNAPFMAGLTVADESYTGYLTQMWNLVQSIDGNYYPDTLTLLSMLYVSGNWWKPDVIE